MIFDFLFFFTPLATTIFLGFYMIVLINNHKRKKQHISKVMAMARSITATNNNSSSNLQKNQPASNANQYQVRSLRLRRKRIVSNLLKLLHLGPQVRFQIIIISYWIQWLPSFLFDLFNPFCECVPANVSSGIYWLTFTVSMTDPLFALLLNPNVILKKSNSRLVRPI